MAAIRTTQALRGGLANLWRVEAHQDLSGFLPRRPEPQKLLEVTGAVHLLPRHGAVNRDLVSGDVLEDPIVGRRRPARIVLRLQTVDRHDDRESGQPAPLPRDLAHRTRDELHVDAPPGQNRKKDVQLAIPHERLAADDREVERPMAIDQREDDVDKRLTLEVTYLTQRDLAAEVVVTVGIAAWAAQRALARNLDGKRRSVPREDPSPSRKDALHYAPSTHTIALDALLRPVA